MRVPFSYLPEQFTRPEPILEDIRAFLKRCDFTLGEDVAEFERRYAAFCGAKHAIGVGSGTDALFLSLKALGLGAGDEVITAPNSFIATTGAIVQAGARPAYVDVGEDLNLRLDRIEGAITRRTKAILPVHWAGCPAELEPLLEIARRHGLPVIEDACQALGARYAGQHVGTFGIAGAFSVHPLKPLHVWGDGGVIVTSDDELAAKLRLLRNHGLAGRDVVSCFGYNTRLDNLQAIVGLRVMESLQWSLDQRVRFAKIYDDAFRASRFAGKIGLPIRSPRQEHAVHLYQVFTSRREELLTYLISRGVEAKVHYPTPLHLQPAARGLGYEKGQFPMAERQSEESLTLPCHQYLSEAQIDFVITTVAEFFGA